LSSIIIVFGKLQFDMESTNFNKYIWKRKLFLNADWMTKRRMEGRGDCLVLRKQLLLLLCFPFMITFYLGSMNKHALTYLFMCGFLHNLARGFGILLCFIGNSQRPFNVRHQIILFKILLFMKMFLIFFIVPSVREI